MKLGNSAITSMDLDAIVGFAEHFLSNAGSVWVESSPEMKRKIQHALFPTGVHFDG